MYQVEITLILSVLLVICVGIIIILLAKQADGNQNNTLGKVNNNCNMNDKTETKEEIAVTDNIIAGKQLQVEVEVMIVGDQKEMLIQIPEKDPHSFDDKSLGQSNETSLEESTPSTEENHATRESEVKVDGPSTVIVENEDDKKENSRIRAYTAIEKNVASFYGMSIQGTGHIADGKPCQDFHKIEILNMDCFAGIAVVSDGAGSKTNSHYGSSLICEKAVQYLKEAVDTLGWGNDNMPNITVWEGVIRQIVRLIQIDLFQYAKEKSMTFDSLGATFMMLFFTSSKSFFAHVGDGRAGVRTEEGWKSILTPHKGEEANQTVFLTNDILKEGLSVSGVSVPEVMVIDKPISAFVLMSDGCEDGLWNKNKKEILPNGDFRYVKLNKPFEPALNDILAKISSYKPDEIQQRLYEIIDHYNKPLKNEIDDKTLCIGMINC